MNEGKFAASAGAFLHGCAGVNEEECVGATVFHTGAGSV
jgi:hypothetical protein